MTAIRKYIKHGLTGTKLRSTWKGMMNRCYNPKAYRYDLYGGAGITVCEEWKDLRGYALWYNSTYIEGMTMEREDPTLGYNPDNVSWKSWEHQASTRRIRSDNKTGFIGVYEVSGRFRAKYKSKYIGSYDTAKLANQAREDYVYKYIKENYHG